jgi:RNA recognition motif-containing protein
MNAPRITPINYNRNRLDFNLRNKENWENQEVSGMSFSKLYVGNLNDRTTEEALKQLFGQHGEVTSVNILQGRGFGFIEMATAEAAQDSKGKLNGTEFDGRKLIVNDARPRTDRPGADRSPGGGGDRRGFSRY